MMIIGDGFKGVCSSISGTTLSPLSPSPFKWEGELLERGVTPLLNTPFKGGRKSGVESDIAKEIEIEGDNPKSFYQVIVSVANELHFKDCYFEIRLASSKETDPPFSRWRHDGNLSPRELISMGISKSMYDEHFNHLNNTLEEDLRIIAQKLPGANVYGEVLKNLLE